MSVPDKIDPLKALLDKLVPPREVVVTDLAGNEYRVPGVVSARRNVEVIRHLQAVLAEPAVARAVGGLDEILAGGDLAESILHVVGIVASPEVVDHLARAFATAHPEALAGAQRAYVTGAGGVYVPGARDLPDAADLFAVEELAAGLVPLFVGLAKRSVQALYRVGGALA